MSKEAKEIPYQLSVNQLQDALDHIMRLAKASRSQTKRLNVIAARAEMALNGEVYDGTNLQLPEPARAPMSYEKEIRVTKRELMAALEREQALAAHLDRLKLSFHELVGCSDDDKELCGDILVQECDFDCVIADFKAIPASSLVYRDLLVRAQELEDFADSLPKFQSMGAGMAMKLKARELRRQAEGVEREESAVA